MANKLMYIYNDNAQIYPFLKDVQSFLMGVKFKNPRIWKNVVYKSFSWEKKEEKREWQNTKKICNISGSEGTLDLDLSLYLNKHIH